jgi:D-alanyl-D-alanine carboxypeptidase
MMTLREQQSLFVQLVGLFIEWCYAQGYELTFAEAWRSPQEAALQAAAGAGIVHSLHTERLAIDLNLFKDGQLLQTRSDYAPLGAQWKSMHELARWGGDFARVDADHFSLTYGGVS